jgi:hypothetical protein
LRKEFVDARGEGSRHMEIAAESEV